MSLTSTELVTIDEIRAAATRVADRIVRTPLLPATWSAPGRPLWLKPENLQTIGAFKIRGALNAIGALPEDARARGIVTHSSGNHGQAVALAAREYGVKAVVVMPDVSATVKVDAVRALGAEVALVPGAERDSAMAALVEAHEYATVPPFDHRGVIAGQGTIALEIVEDLPELAAVLVPVGGGGLVSGVAAAVKVLRPDVAVIGVEPELAADAAESLRRGARVDWPIEQRFRTIADGVRTNLSDLTWQHIRALVDDILTVTEDQIRDAMRLLATRANLVAEPSGALATAAYVGHGDALPAGPVAAVISGGNVEPALLASVLAG